MIRFTAILGAFFVGLWIYCMLDAITSRSAEVRHLPKPVWVLIVVLLPTVGSVAWLALGRQRSAWDDAGNGEHAGSRSSRQPRPEYRGPEDDPEFWSR